MNLRQIKRGGISLRDKVSNVDAPDRASQAADIASGATSASHQVNAIRLATTFGGTHILQNTFDAARRVSRYWAERATPRRVDREPLSETQPQ